MILLTFPLDLYCILLIIQLRPYDSVWRLQPFAIVLFRQVLIVLNRYKTSILYLNQRHPPWLRYSFAWKQSRIKTAQLTQALILYLNRRHHLGLGTNPWMICSHMVLTLYLNRHQLLDLGTKALIISDLTEILSIPFNRSVKYILFMHICQQPAFFFIYSFKQSSLKFSCKSVPNRCVFVSLGTYSSGIYRDALLILIDFL